MQDFLALAQQNGAGTGPAPAEQTDAVQTDSELVLDQNAKIVDGEVYVPNPDAIIKGEKVFVPEPNATQGESGNWCLPNGTVLDEVIVSSSTGTVYGWDPEAKIKTLDDGIGQVAYTID